MVPTFGTTRKTNGTRLSGSTAAAAVHCAGLGNEARGTRQAVSSTVSSAGLLLVCEENLGLLPLEPIALLQQRPSHHAITAVCSQEAKGFDTKTAAAAAVQYLILLPQCCLSAE